MRKLFLLLIAAVLLLSGQVYADSLFSDSDSFVDLPLASFQINDGTGINTITASTAPGFELDNKLNSIVWADNEVTPISVTFKVPHDYFKDGEFRILADESNSTTPNKIDFQVYVNRDGQTWDTAATDQTPVALAGTAGTPDVVQLKPVTDFNGLRPNDYVTFQMWRDNVAIGNGDLEAYHVRFYYKRKLNQ